MDEEDEEEEKGEEEEVVVVGVEVGQVEMEAERVDAMRCDAGWCNLRAIGRQPRRCCSAVKLQASKMKYSSTRAGPAHTLIMLRQVASRDCAGITRLAATVMLPSHQQPASSPNPPRQQQSWAEADASACQHGRRRRGRELAPDDNAPST